MEWNLRRIVLQHVQLGHVKIRHAFMPSRPLPFHAFMPRRPLVLLDNGHYNCLQETVLFFPAFRLLSSFVCQSFFILSPARPIPPAALLDPFGKNALMPRRPRVQLDNGRCNCLQETVPLLFFPGPQASFVSQSFFFILSPTRPIPPAALLDFWQERSHVKRNSSGIWLSNQFFFSLLPL